MFLLVVPGPPRWSPESSPGVIIRLRLGCWIPAFVGRQTAQLLSSQPYGELSNVVIPTQAGIQMVCRTASNGSGSLPTPGRPSTRA